MKNHGILTISSILCLLLSWTSHAQTNIVYYGSESNTLGVVFADTNLSISVQSAITDDLNLCLRDWARESVLRFRADGHSVGYLDVANPCPHYRDGVEFPVNVVSNQTTGLSLYISQELCEAYTNALAFVAANSNMVASAYEFVTFVSSTNFANLAATSLPDYMTDRRRTPAAISAKAAQIIPALRYQTYYQPSILGFQYLDLGPHTTNLWLTIPCSSPLSGDWRTWSPFYAIWHDGRWKFCFWDAAP